MRCFSPKGLGGGNEDNVGGGLLQRSFRQIFRKWLSNFYECFHFSVFKFTLELLHQASMCGISTSWFSCDCCFPDGFFFP